MSRGSMNRAVVLFAAGVWSPAAGAAVLTQYTFPVANTTTETGSAYAATTVGSGVSATSLTDGGASINITSDGALAYGSAPVLRVFPGGTDAATAVTNNSYVQFTVTPDANTQMDLSSFTFDAARGGTNGPRGYAVRSSVDGFAGNIATADITANRPNFAAFNVPLSAASFQGLTAATTFRLYVYSPSNTSTVEFDNLTLNGTTSPVPEPASAGAAIAMLGGLLVRRRRPQ